MDRKIIKEAKKGNIEAFSKIVDEKYIKSLYVTARAKTVTDEDAKDIVQETIKSAYANISSLKNVEKFKSWILTILMNKISDSFREGYYEHIEFDTDIENIGEDVFADVDRKIDLYSMINALDESDRNLILLYMKGYKSDEIAKKLHIKSSNTVRSNIMRIKIRLKSEFGDKEDYES